MMSLKESSAIYSRVSLELARRGPIDPWTWMFAHRRFRNSSPDLIWPLQDIINDLSPLVVIQKSAQIGITDLLVTLALYCADTGYAGRGNVLYLMPTQDQMEDFAQSRFDTAISESPYLRGRLRAEPPRRKGADNKRLKRLGDGLIYMRSAESERQIAGVDADLVILDEYDQMAPDTLELAKKRIASSTAGRVIVASTPRYPETGVNGLYLNSDRMRYWIECSDCRFEQILDWPESVDMEDAVLRCKNCTDPIDNLARGLWRASVPDGAPARGYHLNRLYSPWVRIPELISASRSSSVRGAKEFQNSDLGEVFLPPGGGLTLADLDVCRDGYTFDEYAGESCIMGVDVGTVLHVVVRQDTGHRREAEPSPSRLWFAGTVGSFTELSELHERFNVRCCVIDAQPETRAAVQFAEQHPQTAIAYYTSIDNHKLERIPASYVRQVKINRSLAFEELVDDFRTGNRPIPRNARQIGAVDSAGIGDYYRQVMAPIPLREEDSSENWSDRWSNQGRPDHFAHAELYALMAAGAGRQIPFAVS